jgi:hypothetical protein
MKEIFFCFVSLSHLWGWRGDGAEDMVRKMERVGPSNQFENLY